MPGTRHKQVSGYPVTRLFSSGVRNAPHCFGACYFSCRVKSLYAHSLPFAALIPVNRAECCRVPGWITSTARVRLFQEKGTRPRVRVVPLEKAAGTRYGTILVSTLGEPKHVPGYDQYNQVWYAGNPEYIPQ